MLKNNNGNQAKIAHNEEKDSSQKNAAKADAWSAIVLFLLGAYFCFKGFKMPVDMFTKNPNMWYVGPGFFPMFTGSLVCFFAILIFIKAKRQMQGASLINIENIKTLRKNDYLIRLAQMIVLLTIYIFVLIGRVKFYIATFFYLLLSMFLFRKKTEKIWVIVIVSLAATAAITYGFGNLARIPLP